MSVLQIDRLEARKLLSSVLDPVTGILTVTGSANADTIVVSLSGANINVTIAPEGANDSFLATAVNSIVINSLALGDSITVNATVVKPTTIDAGDGNDTVTCGGGGTTVTGGAGADSVTGGAASDSIAGNAGADTLNGGDGDDRIDPGTENDSVSGGAGSGDTLTYQSRTEALTVRIDGGGTSGTIGETDTVAADFENAVGGTGDDLVIGNAAGNIIGGDAGNDTLDGGTGSDQIFGDAGSDTLTYASRTSPVTVTLGDSTNNDGEAGENDALNTIENVIGGTGNDTLTGDGNANALTGGDGDDILDGLLGSDIFDGGAGNDTVTYALRTAALGLSIDSTGNDGEPLENDNIMTTI
jgi:Ca2+-binding RTX toxin-like protein